jgi:hypothetical protein
MGNFECVTKRWMSLSMQQLKDKKTQVHNNWKMKKLEHEKTWLCCKENEKMQ